MKKDDQSKLMVKKLLNVHADFVNKSAEEEKEEARLKEERKRRGDLIIVSFVFMFAAIAFAFAFFAQLQKNNELNNKADFLNNSLAACNDLLQFEMSNDEGYIYHQSMIQFGKYCKEINGSIYYSDDTIKGYGCLLK